MENNLYNKEFKPSYYDFDFQMNLKNTTLFNYMQDVAGEHSDILGCGKNSLAEKHLHFVLVRTRLDVFRPIRYGEKLIITTYPLPPEKLLFERKFVIETENGERVAECDSFWCLINGVTKRVAPASSVSYDICKYFDLNVKSVAVKKLTNTCDNCNSIFSPSYNDLDFNRHVNNAKYCDIILSQFSSAEISGYYINAIQINYEKECVEGDSVEIFKSKTDEGYLVSGVCEKGEIFSSYIELKKISNN